jgi:hypothetical protein
MGPVEMHFGGMPKQTRFRQGFGLTVSNKWVIPLFISAGVYPAVSSQLRRLYVAPFVDLTFLLTSI